MVTVFFFKQKTAYEMRISDWSPDVCSSDLDDYAAMMVTADSRDQNDPDRLKFCGAGAMSLRDRDNYALLMRIDRKSAVQGKSVSVRVDLGGRRSIKKKHNISDRYSTLTVKLLRISNTSFVKIIQLDI